MDAVDQARKLFENRQYERCADVLRKVLARDGTNIDAWYLRGCLHLEIHQAIEAERSFEQVLRVDPSHANAHFYLGEISRGRADGNAARQHYYAALAANPSHQSAAARVAELLSADQGARGSGSPGTNRGSDRPPESAPRTETQQTLRPPREPKSWNDSAVGIVENLSLRNEAAGSSMTARTIYTFRLRVFDREGNEHPLKIGVELRGLGFKGSLANGDWVEVDRRGKREGEALEVHSIRNLSTGGDVMGRRFRF